MASSRISSSSVSPVEPVTSMPESPVLIRSPFLVRNSDLLLAIFFGALILFAHDAVQRLLIFGMAILQLIEGRIPILKTPAGRMTSVFIQLVLGIVLMHQDGDIA